MAAAFAIIVDGDFLLWFPVAEWEIMRNDARSLPELLLEQRPDLVIGAGQQVDRDHVGGTVILFEDIAMNDARRFLEAEFPDLLHALVVKVVDHLDAGGVGAEFLTRQYH